jgi:hypothetical protein
LLTIYNQDKVPGEEPIFSNQKFATQAKLDFDNLIDYIHTATLSLRPEVSLSNKIG